MKHKNKKPEIKDCAVKKVSGGWEVWQGINYICFLVAKNKKWAATHNMIPNDPSDYRFDNAQDAVDWYAAG